MSSSNTVAFLNSWVFLLVIPFELTHATLPAKIPNSLPCAEQLSSSSRSDLDIWLQTNQFKMTTAAKNIQASLFNPNTREIRYLPKGWILPQDAAINGTEPWVLAQHGRHEEAIFNFLNIKTGEFLLSKDQPEKSPLISANSFQNGRAIVASKLGQFIINETGSLRPLPDGLKWVSSSINDGFIAATIGDEHDSVYIDLNSRIHKPSVAGLNRNSPTSKDSPIEVTSAWDFSNGLAVVRVGTNKSYDPHSKFGYINKSLQWVIPPRFEEAESFGKDGQAWAKLNGLWGRIDRDGKWTIKPKFSKPGRGESSEFIVASAAGDLNDAIYDSKGIKAFDLPAGAKSTQFSAFVRDGVVFLDRTDSEGRFYDLRNREWIGDFNYRARSSFKNGYAVIEIYGAELGDGMHAFAEGYISRAGEPVDVQVRFGAADQFPNLPNKGAGLGITKSR